LLSLIYGEDQIAKEQPFAATLNGGVWTIEGQQSTGNDNLWDGNKPDRDRDCCCAGIGADILVDRFCILYFPSLFIISLPHLYVYAHY
jgi:hypothetical protein